jgi:hypothetical protein
MFIDEILPVATHEHFPSFYDLRVWTSITLVSLVSPSGLDARGPTSSSELCLCAQWVVVGLQTRLGEGCGTQVPVVNVCSWVWFTWARVLCIACCVCFSCPLPKPLLLLLEVRGVVVCVWGGGNDGITTYCNSVEVCVASPSCSRTRLSGARPWRSGRLAWTGAIGSEYLDLSF